MTRSLLAAALVCLAAAGPRAQTPSPFIAELKRYYYEAVKRNLTAMVEKMKPGSVIVDLAAENGGNVECSRLNEEVIVHGVQVLGPRNLAGLIAQSINKQAGTGFVLIPYNTTTNAMQDSVTGRVQVTIQAASIATSFVSAGTLRPAARRSPA